MSNPSAEDLPPEVAELYERDGQWSQTRSLLFYFTCDCGNSGICRCEKKDEEDQWLRNCGTKDCEFHGEHEVAYSDITEEESKRRHKQNKEIESKGSKLIDEIEHYLGVAASLDSKDTDDAALLDKIIDDVIRKYVFMGRDEAVVLALWVVHTWCLPAAEFTPYIHLRSAMPREGKSRVLDVLGYVTARAVRMSDPTPAAIADLVTIAEIMGSEPPTFLWDEIDSAYERWPALREYVNNGFQRGNPIIRAGGKRKLTFSPKIMAGLTELPATVHDRSFRFDMTRAKEDEKPMRLTPKERRYLMAEGTAICYALGSFAERNMERLMMAEPELPEALDDRGQDVAEPLLAIADIVGGEWPVKARSALVKVRAAMKKADSQTMQELLLADIKSIFGPWKKSMYSDQLVAQLVDKEDGPWKGLGLNQWKLAKMLHNFVEYPGGPRISSRRMRVGGRTKKAPLKAGYERTQFKDAWERYL